MSYQKTEIKNLPVMLPKVWHSDGTKSWQWEILQENVEERGGDQMGRQD